MGTTKLCVQGRLNGVNINNPMPYAKIELYFNNPDRYYVYEDYTNTDSSYYITYSWYVGSTYNVVVTPYEGYKFVDVCRDEQYYNDELSGTLNVYTYVRLEFRSTHTVSYNVNGGASDPSDQTKTWGDDLFITSEIPTKLGYEFLYWNTQADGNGTTYYPSDQYLNDQAGGTVTLYAIWKVGTYIITFNGNGGNINTDSLEVIYGTSNNHDIGQYIPTRQAYEFLGWYSSPTGGVQVFDATGLCTNDGTYWLNNVCVYTDNYTVYAQWKPLNIAYCKLDGGWRLCHTYVKTEGIWKPAIMYIKSNNKYIR